MPRLKLALLRAFISAALILSLACGAGFVSPLHAGQRPWIEVKSPHFRVLTDGSPNDARKVAREFEQMRAVVAAAFPKSRLETGAILTVLAPSDEVSLKSLAPEYWKNDAGRIAARFQNGRERQYQVVVLNQRTYVRKDSIVYYDYVQSFLKANFQWLPIWLQEGLSYFYGSTRIEGDKAYVGAPLERISILRQAQLIKLSEFTTVNPWIKYHDDPRHVAVYVAESWALVHYLMFSPEMGEGAKLSRYYAAIITREPEAKAFQDIFGDFDQVEAKLRSYIAQYMFKSYVVDVTLRIDDKDYPVRTMSVAETEAEIGTYRIWSHDLKDARVAIEQALRDDPNQPLAVEALGFINYADNKEADARANFAKALSLDSSRYLSLFYKSMLTSYANVNPTAADVAALRTAMYGVTGSNSQFSLAQVQLALAMARAGDLPDALIMMKRAQDSEPNRIGYHLLTARILLAMNRNEEAVPELLFVASRANDISRNEALDLLSNLPDVKAPPGALQESELSQEERAAKTVEGTITSFTCVNKGKMVLQTASGPKTFYAASHHRVAFSESLWFAGDHSVPCNQIERFPAVVRYKPGPANSDAAGDWLTLEVRTDFGSPSLSTQKSDGQKNAEAAGGAAPKQ